MIFLLSFVQGLCFSLTSRSRNRDHIGYHFVASLLSNGVWFWVLRYMIVSELGAWEFVSYSFGCSTGSIVGYWASAWVERRLGAKA